MQTMLPVGTRRAYSAELNCRYNGARLQRNRIVDCLQRAGAAGVSSPDLARLCNVPCLTKRISELRRKGWQIDSHAQPLVGADGTVNTFARYVLDQAPPPQRGLFDSVR